MDRNSYLRDREVAEMLSLSRGHVWRLSSLGILPAPVAIGRSKRWKLADVEAAIEARAARQAVDAEAEQ